VEREFGKNETNLDLSYNMSVQLLPSVDCVHSTHPYERYSRLMIASRRVDVVISFVSIASFVIRHSFSA
jgi:hypothetical protein